MLRDFAIYKTFCCQVPCPTLFDALSWLQLFANRKRKAKIVRGERDTGRHRERTKRNVSGLLYELYLLRVLAAFIVWRREVRLGGRIALLTAVNSQISLFICVYVSRY